MCTWEREGERERGRRERDLCSLGHFQRERSAMFSYQDKLRHTCVVCPAVKKVSADNYLETRVSAKQIVFLGGRVAVAEGK